PILVQISTWVEKNQGLLRNLVVMTVEVGKLALALAGLQTAILLTRIALARLSVQALVTGKSGILLLVTAIGGFIFSLAKLRAAADKPFELQFGELEDLEKIEKAEERISKARLQAGAELSKKLAETNVLDRAFNDQRIKQLMEQIDLADFNLSILKKTKDVLSATPVPGGAPGGELSSQVKIATDDFDALADSILAAQQRAEELETVMERPIAEPVRRRRGPAPGALEDMAARSVQIITDAGLSAEEFIDRMNQLGIDLESNTAEHIANSVVLLRDSLDPIFNMVSDLTLAFEDFALNSADAFADMFDTILVKGTFSLKSIGDLLVSIGKLVEQLIRDLIRAIARALALKALGGALGLFAGSFFGAGVGVGVPTTPISPPGPIDVPLPTGAGIGVAPAGAAGGQTVIINAQALDSTDALREAFRHGALFEEREIAVELGRI
ncbi:MAG: hypothetical protein ACE5JI_17870, partial [Acidobacteriota bacterium]